MLLSVGVPILEALEVSCRVAQNDVVSQTAKDLVQATRAGHPLAKSLQKHQMFPPMVALFSPGSGG